ncbi:MAG: hypothetical protein ABI718_10470 [Acidobacteriota bacterium]
MPDWKSDSARRIAGSPPRIKLTMPAIGMEAEFNVFLDEEEINPEKYWKHPTAFIEDPLLEREKTSRQLPTGGAVYFDRGVIEVVTPLIEIAPGCTARVVRSLWEQIEYVRAQLTLWEGRNRHHVRLKAYSTHYNVSFELPRREQNATRNIKSLALLLAYILPVPVAVAGCNRRSTGVGVRPRGDRVEITVDFTPDPGLMIATATLIVGIVREVMSWPSYSLSVLSDDALPTVRGVVPGKHTTRKGWLTRDFHYSRSPYTCNLDERIWVSRGGEEMSLRQMARQIARTFRRSIRRHSDPFSFRLLFAILEGRAPSLLELRDRPLAYEDVGRLCRWGQVIQEIRDFESQSGLLSIRQMLWKSVTVEDHIAARERERSRFMAAESDLPHHRSSAVLKEADSRATMENLFSDPAAPPTTAVTPPAAADGAASGNPARSAPRAARPAYARRMKDQSGSLLARADEPFERRSKTQGTLPGTERRRNPQRRRHDYSIPFPDRRLARSAYEMVFLKLVSGGKLRIGRQTYTPVGMKGWYHAIFRRDSDGKERLLTIDQLLEKMSDWQV